MHHAEQLALEVVQIVRAEVLHVDLLNATRRRAIVIHREHDGGGGSDAESVGIVLEIIVRGGAADDVLVAGRISRGAAQVEEVPVLLDNLAGHQVRWLGVQQQRLRTGRRLERHDALQGDGLSGAVVGRVLGEEQTQGLQGAADTHVELVEDRTHHDANIRIFEVVLDRRAHVSSRLVMPPGSDQQQGALEQVFFAYQAGELFNKREHAEVVTVVREHLHFAGIVYVELDGEVHVQLVVGHVRHLVAHWRAVVVRQVHQLFLFLGKYHVKVAGGGESFVDQV
mmetsp:Transcript_62739/g.110822  ORF Transcript_62739/g.110822 Transcript_62739/m.110822 type:complete len:282 (+) Transcript_62739:3128-3973(+)